MDHQPSVDVSEQQLFENLSGYQVVLNGIYKYIKNGTNGITVGIAGMQAYNLTSSPDLWIRPIGNGYYNSSIFLSIRTEADGSYANRSWEYHYKIINNCNIILEGIDAFNDDQPEVVAEIKGQTLAIRGWAYFNLARYFQQTYSIAKDMPGVPIYTTRATAERKQADRSTVEQVYTLILDDLNTALGLLANWERPGLEYINKDVVNTFLAQVYLTMQNWSEAESHANAARTGYALMTGEQYRSGFAEANSEWIWGFQQTENDNIRNQNLFGRWNINNHRPEGSPASGDNTLRANESFVNMFEEQDVRNLFWYSDEGELNSGWASDKFRDDGADWYGDMIVTRAAEMYLIEAEALARQNKGDQALALLNALQTSRNASVTTTANKEELIEAIWIEKRKELYSEGLVFWDLLRLEKDLEKEGDAQDYITIPAHSYQFIMQIPTDELNFGGISVQNPLDDIYNP
ncbi:MAG: RagB/SusD family nutrient uptake outer membrane protein [Cytophagales bacterium]|nr:RagB/SusD family nutrient uptake outer membrane protein [Cytophagales bacterium]